MTSWRALPVCGLLLVTTVGADWRQFRGNDSTAVAPGEALPEKFGPDQNIAWKSALPGRGLSSPVVVGHRVFATASGETKKDRLHVLAFDAVSGRKLWERSFWGTGPTSCHPKTTMAAPTPASDGRRLVALFSTNDLVCLDLDGNLLWVRSLYDENPGSSDGRGLASSPIIAGNTVVVHVETQNVSFAAGIDLETGANRWRIDRPREINWSSPILLPARDGGEPRVLLQGTARLSAVDPATGREVWGLKRPSHPIASSVVAGDVLYVPGENALAAFGLAGDAPPKLLWESQKLQPATASPVVVGERIYSLRGPILVTGDVKTGKVLAELRLKGEFSASIVAAGDLLYCFNERGSGNVLKPSPAGMVLASTGELSETILCTPAIAKGAMYVRSDRHLWKIAQGSATP